MEAASKKKRGRPRVYPSDMYPAALFSAGSARGRQNYVYAIEAVTIIGCEATPDFATTKHPLLVDWKGANARRRGAIKFGVLTELGRAGREFSPDIVQMMAERIEAAIRDGRIVTAREAELQVREWRAKLKPAGKASGSSASGGSRRGSVVG